MSDKIVSYDFLVDSLVAVKAPLGTDPDTLVEEALVKLVQKVRDGDIELRCENTFDPETGYYSEIPEEWYQNS